MSSYKNNAWHSGQIESKIHQMELTEWTVMIHRYAGNEIPVPLQRVKTIRNLVGKDSVFLCQAHARAKV